MCLISNVIIYLHKKSDKNTWQYFLFLQCIHCFSVILNGFHKFSDVYRFPILGLSSWSLGRDRGDSHMIIPPPAWSSRTRTQRPVWVEAMYEWCWCPGDWCLGSSRFYPSPSPRGWLWCRCMSDSRMFTDLPAILMKC